MVSPRRAIASPNRPTLQFASPSVQSRLRLRRAGLRRLPDPHPLDSPTERVAARLCCNHLTEEFRLEVVTLLHVRALPELRDQLRQRLLGGLVPRV